MTCGFQGQHLKTYPGIQRELSAGTQEALAYSLLRKRKGKHWAEACSTWLHYEPSPGECSGASGLQRKVDQLQQEVVAHREGQSPLKKDSWVQTTWDLSGPALAR